MTQHKYYRYPKGETSQLHSLSSKKQTPLKRANCKYSVTLYPCQATALMARQENRPDKSCCPVKTLLKPRPDVSHKHRSARQFHWEGLLTMMFKVWRGQQLYSLSRIKQLTQGSADPLHTALSCKPMSLCYKPWLSPVQDTEPPGTAC